MSPTRRSWLLVALAVAAQVAVLAWMAAGREWILRTGRVVYLRTAPIDPRDPFRGDFVRLQYEINSVTMASADGNPAAVERTRRRDEIVYTRLEPSGNGVYEAAGATWTKPPAGELFIRGRTDDGWRLGAPMAPADLTVRYGIEQFYVEQGAGHSIETRRGTRDGVQVPMEIEVAIDSSGTGVIKGYRWCPLGVKLEITRQPARRNRPQFQPQPASGAGEAPETPALAASADPSEPLSPALRVTLVNTSDAPQVIADSDDHCAFQLLSAGWSEKTYLPVVRACGQEGLPVRVITLQPGESYPVELDLSTPRWNVLRNGEPVEVGALPELAMFRVEYRAPRSAVDAQGLWQGRLHTARFNGNGFVD